MSQPTRRPPGRRPAVRTAQAAPEEKRRFGRRTKIILAAAIVAVVGITIGVGYYFVYLRPFQRPVLTVNDTTVSIDYFVRRLYPNRGVVDNLEMLSIIVDEIIVRNDAPQLISDATPDEVEQALRDLARGENETISEPEFRTWYRNVQNETKLSDEQFRELVYTSVLRARLHVYLAERAPTAAEQVHVHAIYLTTESIQKVMDRLEEAGEEQTISEEDFASVAGELSLDPEAQENGGDLGWWARAAFPPEMRGVFDIPVGQFRGPYPLDQEQGIYAVFMVSEGPAYREMDEFNLAAVQAQVVDEWLLTRYGFHEIRFHSLTEGRGFDSETSAWISWQLARLAGE